MTETTNLDREIYAALPDGWFQAFDLKMNKPQYRCERLEKCGLIERRVTGKYPDLVSEFRKKEAV